MLVNEQNKDDKVMRLEKCITRKKSYHVNLCIGHEYLMMDFGMNYDSSYF